MFKKTRKQFLILNMAITALVLLAAFASVYFITGRTMQAENQSKLMESVGYTQIISNNYDEPLSDSSTQLDAMGEGDVSDGFAQSGGLDTSRVVSKNGTLFRIFAKTQSETSFSVIVDAQGKAIEVMSDGVLSEEACLKAAQYALAHPDTNQMKVDGSSWIYDISPGTVIDISNGVSMGTHSDQMRITFLDVSATEKNLRDLLRNFLLVGLGAIIAIFLISRYFASRAIRPLKSAWEKQARFIADASHELKTPLAVIAANHGALVAHPNETVESQIEWLDYQKRGIDRMARLVDDLLTVSRMEGEGAALRREPFDLSSVLREELTMITPRLAEKQLRIAEDIGRALMLASDEGAVRKLLAVFLDNAVKYAETGGRIKVALKQAKRQAIFIVGNSGPGIPTADMDKLFERFYRGDPARSSKIEGYGLGLSIAKSLTERLGGQITVSSEPDLWTEFTVKLPGLRDEA